MDNVIINPSKLHDQLLKAGLPVVSVHSDGRVDYSRPVSIQEQAAAKNIITAFDPVEVKPPTTEQLVHALWLKLMRDDPKEADDLNQIYPES